MNELETFAKFARDKGDIWVCLEHSENASLHKSQEKYMYNHNNYYTSPVYQVFNHDNKRIFAGTNYKEAYECYIRLCKEE